MPLHDYQENAVNDIRSAFLQECNAPLFFLPTGGGKTYVFTYIADQAYRKGKRVLILVHRVELLRQAVKTLKKFGITAGVINPKYKPNYLLPVQVGSVQSVCRRLDILPRPDLIIIDEAHHATAGTWRKTLDYYETRSLGVTATPIRGDGKGLGVEAGGVFDTLIEGPQMIELINRGFLVRPRVINPEIMIDRSQLKTKMGDFDKKQAAAGMNKPSIIGDVVKHYRKFAHGRPAVAFCINIDHAEHTAEVFKSYGYKAASVDGTMDDQKRETILNGLGDGSMDIVTSCDLIGEGLDIPVIGAAIMLRPTKSLGLYLQQAGRALRKSPGKTDAIILDHVGNSSESAHNLPQMPREWSLNGEEKTNRGKSTSEPSIRLVTCEHCYTIQSPAPCCEICGEALRKPKEIKHVDGDLKEVSEEEVLRRLEEKKGKRIEVGRASTLEELKQIAKARGYKAGWVYHQMKIKGIKS